MKELTYATACDCENVIIVAISKQASHETDRPSRKKCAPRRRYLLPICQPLGVRALQNDVAIPLPQSEPDHDKHCHLLS